MRKAECDLCATGVNLNDSGGPSVFRSASGQLVNGVRLALRIFNLNWCRFNHLGLNHLLNRSLYLRGHGGEAFK